MKYLQYIWYLARHKWFVLLECWRVGLYWRGLKHDASKILPSEFIPYANFFYGRKPAKRDSTGYYKPTDTGDAAFDFAWLLHQKRNDHHWQWWLLPEDEGGVKILPMSPNARLEMLCDWRGAGRAQGTPDTVKWYEANKHKLQLHPDTREWVEKKIDELKGTND
jgi:hypothetical protein